jgi:prepilin-type N-terminal cleavage/methylation domain-containing protein
MITILKKSLKRDKKKFLGNTLIEILVAIAILGIGLLSVAGLYPVGLSYIRNSGEKVFVIQQAQATMETLKAMSYQQLLTLYTVTLPGYLRQEPLLDTNGISYPGYISEIRVNLPSATEEVLFLQITISWTQRNSYGRNAVPRTYVLETFKCSTDPK